MKFSESYVGQPVIFKDLETYGYIKRLKYFEQSDELLVVVDVGKSHYNVVRFEDIAPAKGNV